ncbi:amidase [Acidisoma cellulosilytica]|uniref:Amidase n=1 Tax=Acidisoma cellulosilyticum TaxID=2802395 RepID=A0A964E3P8_9PROT|nr:amidase [Acidisoma cellulosilyticum]MCB8880649.1 amidase [Acidisoma cellulosilyticum]
MSELPDLPATALVTAYRERQLSPVDVTRAALARIDAWDEAICATWAMDPEGAMTAARQSEARWMAGTPAGPLDGVPVTVKENIATKGVIMPAGTAAIDAAIATEDAPAAARLRESGAVILGKTTMPDFGMLSSGLSSFHRLARNPWNLAMNPGGSSAGASAAAAAGYAPINIGTDIGGSVRLPAALCGAVALKPSFGRIPVSPPFLGRAAGPITRTVADAALAMQVLSLPDARDYMSLPPADLDWSAEPLPLRGLRIGLCLHTGIGSDPEPEIVAAITDAARLFAEAGAIVEPLGPFLRLEMVEGLNHFWQTRFGSDTASLSDAQRAKILPYIRDWIEGGDALSGRDVYRGFTQIPAMSQATQKATQAFDYVLLPVWPTVSFPAEFASPLNDPARPFDHIGYCVGFNMSEQPALSVNCGYAQNGMPIGLQISGRRFDDVGVLRMGAAFEVMRAPQRPWPRLDN